MTTLFIILGFIAFALLYAHIQREISPGICTEVFAANYQTNSILQTSCNIGNPVVFSPELDSIIYTDLCSNHTMNGKSTLHTNTSIPNSVPIQTIDTSHIQSLMESDIDKRYHANTIIENTSKASQVIDLCIAPMFCSEYIPLAQTRMVVTTGSSSMNTFAHNHSRWFISVMPPLSGGEGKGIRVRVANWKLRTPSQTKFAIGHIQTIHCDKTLSSDDDIREIYVYDGCMLYLPPYTWCSIEFIDNPGHQPSRICHHVYNTPLNTLISNIGLFK